MILLCNVCKPESEVWKYHEEGVLAIAKWYPAGGPGSIGGSDGSYYSHSGFESIGKFLVRMMGVFLLKKRVPLLKKMARRS